MTERNEFGKELAKYLKKKSAISKYYINDVQPSIEVSYEIAKFLDIDIRKLFVPTKES